MYLQRLARFHVVGGSGVIVNSLALFLLYGLVGLPFLVASAVSVELAITNNFVWNDVWTFARSGGTRLGRFAKYNTIALIGLIVTTVTAWALVNLIGVPYLVANLLGIGLAALCNFAASTLWAWRSY
jgi:dolichol-phosphate mannosyltransferase